MDLYRDSDIDRERYRERDRGSSWSAYEGFEFEFEFEFEFNLNLVSRVILCEAQSGLGVIDDPAERFYTRPRVVWGATGTPPE